MEKAGRFRHVACRAKQARVGATADAIVETVETEEMEEAREKTERSEIMDSGLGYEEADATLVMEGRREVEPGNTSMVHRVKPVLWAIAIAEQMDGRRELQVLAAGVLEAIEGVICGVGSGPIRGTGGGSMFGVGSRNRGMTVAGVGVPSCDIDSSCANCEDGRVGVMGVGKP